MVDKRLSAATGTPDTEDGGFGDSPFGGLNSPSVSITVSWEPGTEDDLLWELQERYEAMRITIINYRENN